MKIWTLLLFVSTSAWATSKPDPVLTPGEVDPSATAALVCGHLYTKSARNVPQSEKKAVLRAYRAKHPNWPHGPYELDHLVSLELGGLNGPKNLWPQVLSEARRKDVLETRWHRAVCRGQMSLKQAQAQILHWWDFE